MQATIYLVYDNIRSSICQSCIFVKYNCSTSATAGDASLARQKIRKAMEVNKRSNPKYTNR